MAAFVQPAAGATIEHTHVTQFAKAWEGEVGSGSHPLSLALVNDATHYGLDVQQNNAGGLVGRFLNHLGETVLTMIHNRLTIGQDVVVSAGKLIDGVDVGAHQHTGGAGQGPQIPTAALVDGFLSADIAGRLKMEDGYTTAAKLATDSVETIKIKDLNVTAGKLAVDSVETAKIKDLNVTEGKLAAAVSAQLVTGGDTHDHSGGDGAAIPLAALGFDPATQAELDAQVAITNGHAALTSPHSAAAAATPSRLLVRDAAGRGKVVAPAAADDIALKSTITADIATHQALTSPHSATSAGIANRLLVRDAAGRAKVAAPAAVDDIPQLANVTTVQTNLNTHAALAVAGTHGSTTAATANKLVHRDAAGRAKVVAPAGATDIALKSTVTADIATHSAGGDHDGRYFTEAEDDARFAPIAKGVTNGDAHNHVGGDGGAIVAGGLANGAVDTTARLANDIVDDTKVGNRVPQFYRRQGGSATHWNSRGVANFTPTGVRMYGGCVGELYGVGQKSGSWAITYPVAFSGAPLVFLTVQVPCPMVIAYVSNPTANGCTVNWQSVSEDGAAAPTYLNVDIGWLAIGPE